MTDALDRFPVTLDYPVGWGDMDAFGHVNNTIYFRWFEHGRIAYFGRCGFSEHMKTHRVGPILARTDCRFRLPLAYPDTVTIGARVEDVQLDRFTMVYRVVSHRHDAIAADGTGSIVCFDYNQGRKAPLPEVVRAAIEALESG